MSLWKFFEDKVVFKITFSFQHFLAVANQGTNDSLPDASSAIYRWDRKRRKFLVHQYIQTFSARSWASFSIEGKHYLAGANYAGRKQRRSYLHVHVNAKKEI